MKASISASTLTSAKVARCISPCAAKKHARSGIRDEPEGAPSPIRGRSICVQRWWPSAPVLATGKTTWSLGQKQALVTINERTSRYSLIGHVPFKTAKAVSGAMIAMLKPLSMCVHTLTTDNGREFARHERISAALDADFFFAHPYSSWERGANENMNGLIRQFFPKKIAFDAITIKEIELAMHRLNHRPRKCLDYRTPHEVFMEQLQLHNQSVALQT